MKTKTALKCIEVLNSISINPNRALEQRLLFVKQFLEQEIVKNKIRANNIKNSKELKGG